VKRSEEGEGSEEESEEGSEERSEEGVGSEEKRRGCRKWKRSVLSEETRKRGRK
jgi:hypothetical protein